MRIESPRIPFEIFAILLIACPAALSAQPAAPDATPPAAGATARGTGADCADGLALDDGVPETGYGWVPSVPDGEYVQRFLSRQLPNRRLESVCVCWLRTRDDADVDFEVVFYADAGGQPAAEPYAAVPASANVTPVGIVGAFFEVDVTGVSLPRGASYVGARWDPSSDPFFFLCTDTSDGTEPVEVFYRDELAEGVWTSVFESNDPIFDAHRALMIRVRSGTETAIDVPALGAGGLALLGIVLATIAILALGRRRSS